MLAPNAISVAVTSLDEKYIVISLSVIVVDLLLSNEVTVYGQAKQDRPKPILPALS
jgi:hypothetical protein